MLETINNIDYCLDTLNNEGIVVVDFGNKEKINETYNSAKAIFENQNNLRNPVISSGLADYIGHTFMVDGAIDLYLNENILEIAERYTGAKMHLSNHRIFRNKSSLRGAQAWHKDNKMDFLDEFGAHRTVVIENDRGLIMMFYLSDVEEGGTEFILGSHKKENDREVFPEERVLGLGERFVANGFEAGTVILYDYRMIHRASPVKNLSHERISLFAQISPENMPAGEPILLPSSKVGALSSRQANLLNFNTPPTAPNWPLESSSATSRFINIVKGMIS